MDLDWQPLTKILNTTCSSKDSSPDPNIISLCSTVELQAPCGRQSSCPICTRMLLHHWLTTKMSKSNHRNHHYVQSIVPQWRVGLLAHTQVFPRVNHRCYFFLLYNMKTPCMLPACGRILFNSIPPMSTVTEYCLKSQRLVGTLSCR